MTRPKERPILFSGPMVRALLDGRKTQTRRVVKPQPHLEHGYWRWRKGGWNYPVDDRASVRRHMKSLCPHGAPGDRLWVRETWYCQDKDPNHVWYRADEEDPESGLPPIKCPWRPSIHMPRWASRITLELTAVRVERLQDISEADAIAEGATEWGHEHLDEWCRWSKRLTPSSPVGTAIGAFAGLWDSLNAKRAPWASNSWVWVLEFKRVQP